MVNLGPEVEASTKLAGKSAGDVAEEVARIAKLTGNSVDEVFAAAKTAGKLDDAAISAAKEFKASSSVLEDIRGAADVTKGVTAGDLKLAGKEGEAVAEETAAEAKATQAEVKDSKGFLKKAGEKCTGNAKWCAGAVLGSAAAIYAADKYLKIKAYKGKITKIEPYVDGGLPIIGGGTDVAKVTYSEAVDILPTDTLSISNTDCSPPIDGDQSPYKIASKTEVWIKVEAPLTASGSKGDFTITTGVVERLGEAVGKGAGAAGSAAGTAAGAAAAGLGQGGSAFLKAFTGGAGMWLTLLLCCLCFAFIIFKFIL